ncbi:MAG: GNAT family N-acetyltransferase [Thermoleophilia bacterium]|nr:GNAT family N-acetyltransferase [Thermoleophilia bacterium]
MDSPMAIRRLTHLEPATLGELVEYGRSALGDSALDEWMLPVIASCGLLYVGRVGEETVGAAEILGILDSGDIYLEGFYIRPEMQGRGHGTELMLGVIDLLAREGFKRMLVTLAPENEAGTKLYDKTGFREIDYLPDHYGAGRHRLLLAVELRGPEKPEIKE